MTCNMWQIFLLAVLTAASCENIKFSPRFVWSTIDYAFPNDSIKQSFAKLNKYIPESNIPIGISLWKDKMFVTVPKWRQGVVSTLNYISLSAQSNDSVLTPYPDWPYDSEFSPNGNRIISALHARPDVCDRLWLIDVGIENLLERQVELSPPSVIVIDLKTNKIIRNHTLTKPLHKDRTFFADFIVDVDEKSCDDAHTYISDPLDHGLTVYSWKTDQSWRFDHASFGPDPKGSDFNVTGVNFHWRDGILSLALSPPKADGSKTLYYHAVASFDEYAVSTSVLKNKNNSEVDYYYWFNLVGNRGVKSQALTAHMNTESGILFFPLINQHGIACWNIEKPIETNMQIITQDYEKLAFLSDLAVDHRVDDRLYALASNFPKYIYKQIGPNDQFIVYTEKLSKLTAACS